MWLFTTYGFFSIVAHASKPGGLLVRARTLQDLAALRKQIVLVSGTDIADLDIYETEEADYPYRLTVGREALASVAANELLTMTATNFKKAVSAKDPARAHLYTRIWWELKSALNPYQLNFFGEADERTSVTP